MPATIVNIASPWISTRLQGLCPFDLFIVSYRVSSCNIPYCLRQPHCISIWGWHSWPCCSCLSTGWHSLPQIVPAGDCRQGGHPRDLSSTCLGTYFWHGCRMLVVWFHGFFVWKIYAWCLRYFFPYIVHGLNFVPCYDLRSKCTPESLSWGRCCWY